MAEAEAAQAGAKGGMEFLKQKIGPLPAGAWIAAFAVMWWYLQKRKAGSGTAAAGANQQTDPAGNIGSINPGTGYVYGTPEDQAAQASGNAQTGTVTGSGGSTVAGAYPDNNAWANAAINYLVGIGVDPTAANSAIEQFLASQPLTVSQQGEVNTAIQRIGAPPQPPQPGTAPSPIVAPPSPGTIYATNPPTGIAVVQAAKTSISLKWNKATNATGYTIFYGKTSAANTWSTTTSGGAGDTIGLLSPNTRYYFRVQANPAKSGAGFGAISATTSKT